jgi:hypothetical protein
MVGRRFRIADPSSRGDLSGPRWALDHEEEEAVRYRNFAVLVLGVLAFAAAGCGGDSSSSEASSDTQAEETATVDETAEDTTALDTTADDATDTSSLDAGDLSADCLGFAGIGAKISEAMGGANGGTADMSKTMELFDQLVASAPDEIKDDLQVIADGVGTLAEAMKGIDLTSGATPSADDLAKMQKALASVDSAKLQAASQNVEAWAKDNCKA